MLKTIEVNNCGFSRDFGNSPIQMRDGIFEALFEYEDKFDEPVTSISVEGDPLPDELVKLLVDARENTSGKKLGQIDGALQPFIRKQIAVDKLANVLEDLREINQNTPELPPEDQQTLNKIIWSFDELEVLKGKISPS